jgi:hypothetical protein
MGYFHKLLKENGLEKHDGRPLWKYNFSDEMIFSFQRELQHVNPDIIDSRDFTLWFAVWWQKLYDGGAAKKQTVFSALGGDLISKISSNIFFKIAQDGSVRLGLKWIEGNVENELKFRTLLLQGGLPLNHIKNNSSNYFDFIKSLVRENIRSVDEIDDSPHLFKKLPVSARKRHIYENCLFFIEEIQNNESEEYEILFNKNNETKKGYDEIKFLVNRSLKQPQDKKPKVFWKLNKTDDKFKIHLHLGFNEVHRKEEDRVLGSEEQEEIRHELYSVLGFAPIEKLYNIYIDNVLKVKFIRNRKGDYKTHYFSGKQTKWKKNQVPEIKATWVDNQQILSHLIQHVPKLNKPTLWAKSGEKGEWKYIRTNICNADQAAILYPDTYEIDKEFQLLVYKNHTFNWFEFTGQTKLYKDTKTLTYQTGVTAFDWTIESQQPAWMRNANMPVINGRFQVFIYDNTGKRIRNSKVSISYRSKDSNANWIEYNSRNILAIGCYTARITYDNITVEDDVYNIGDLNVKYLESSLYSSKLLIEKSGSLSISLDESDLVSIETYNNIYNLSIDPQKRKIPRQILGRLKLGNQKSLRFAICNPFSGIGLLDQSGNLLHEWTTLSLTNLAGYHIMCSGENSIVYFKNDIEVEKDSLNAIRISSLLTQTETPLSDLIDFIKPVLSLDDVFNTKNKVTATIESGRNKFCFKIGLFSHSIYHSDETSILPFFNLYKSKSILNLFALPLNCELCQIEAYTISKDGENYQLPAIKDIYSYVVVSQDPWITKQQHQLRPTFRTTKSPQDEGVLSPTERIKNYHDALLANDYSSSAWQELLTYFKFCIQFDLPYSTFDQIRAIQRSRECAVKAFFYLAINSGLNNFSDTISLEIERDLGFCFFWAGREEWQSYFHYWLDRMGDEKVNKLTRVMNEYFKTVDFEALLPYVYDTDFNKTNIDNFKLGRISSCLGERTAKELPKNIPFTNSEYRIPIQNHGNINFLIKSAIAVAESIIGNDHPDMNLWGYTSSNARIRRGVQYAHSLSQQTKERYREKTNSIGTNNNFFSDIIIHVLSHSN